ncbi:MAG: galactonate dehydratase [Fimbriimonadaceae bacterium]|nr:galactonate dehydratase [Fimbriimonadaceae bacterium]
MKITAVTTRLLPPRWSLVRIETDAGIVGYGEPTLEGQAKTACVAVEQLARTLIGEDPRRIEHLWQAMYRGGFYRGGPILCSAISGIEQALWDIVGKLHGVPVYALLGGACRDKIRMYCHAGGNTPAEAAAAARRAQEAGFTALKTGMVSGATQIVDTPRVVDEAVARIAAMREAVGREMDIAIDCHGRLSTAMAIRLCDAVADLQPMFVEEPVLPENVDALKKVVAHVNVPIATGERLFTKFGFRPVLEAGAADIVQPDLSHAGGILECKKIAAMAEAWYAGLAPHCPLGPISLAACLQLDACCPNFVIQEHTIGALGEGYLRQPLVIENGYLALPTGPGLGIELDEEAIAAMPEHDWVTPQLRHSDGSVADW